MTKTIVGSALGGLTAAAVALGLSAFFRGTPSSAQVAEGMTPPPVVQCAPHQEAMMQRVLLGGREATALVCANRADAAYGMAPQPGYANAYAAPGYMQAAYMQPLSQPVYEPAPVAAPRPAVQRRTVSAPARERVVYVDREEDVRREPKRSWAKTAMILGGSAGAGAGVGGIMGGKKGALIGAAIGGGAASIYEATKR